MTVEAPLVVNDVHSALNETVVAGVARPASLADLREAIAGPRVPAASPRTARRSPGQARSATT